jgi:Rab-GTPase-TBC domain
MRKELWCVSKSACLFLRWHQGAVCNLVLLPLTTGRWSNTAYYCFLQDVGTDTQEYRNRCRKPVCRDAPTGGYLFRDEKTGRKWSRAPNEAGVALPRLRCETLLLVWWKGQDLDEAVASDIEKDIGRTFPEVARFSEQSGTQALMNVLKAYAAFDPEVSYCQGMNFLAGEDSLQF